MAGQTKFCRKCGKQIAAEAGFCRFCGYKFELPAQQANGTQTPQGGNAGRAAGGTAAATAMTAAQWMVSQAANSAQITASKSGGEVAIGNNFSIGNLNIGGTDFGNVVNRAEEILSPIKTLGGGIKSFFSGILSVFRNPKQAIFPLLLAILWSVLPLIKGDGDNAVVNVLSWLTFSEGGFNRNAGGALGGILGKGTVAVAISSLFTGGIGSALRGIKSLFTGNGEKRSIPAVIAGVLIGAALYVVYVGLDTASTATSMAGISGVLLSLEALGSQDGFAWSMLKSVTAKKVNGVRTAQNGALNSLFTGVTAGFAAITAISVIL